MLAWFKDLVGLVDLKHLLGPDQSSEIDSFYVTIQVLDAALYTMPGVWLTNNQSIQLIIINTRLLRAKPVFPRDPSYGLYPRSTTRPKLTGAP
jgi:hypothetical protein